MAPSKRRKRALYNARGLPPSLGVTGAWLTQRKMAVNGCVFESECLYLCSECVYGMLLVDSAFENRRLFFGSVKGQNGTAGWMCRCQCD